MCFRTAAVTCRSAANGLPAVDGAACAGDADAAEQILRQYYENCINKLRARTVCGERGCLYARLNEYMNSCLENKPIRAIPGVN